MTAETPTGRALEARHAAGEALAGLEAGGHNLAGVSLPGANLAGANLAGAVLEGADLRGANLGRADLSGAVLSGTDLRGANLRGAQGVGVLAPGVDLRDADLRDGRFDGSSFRGARLEGAAVQGASFGDSDLLGVPRAHLAGARTVGALLESAARDDRVPDAKARTFMLDGSPYRANVWAAPAGSAATRPVLALHGFTGSGLDFGPLVPALARTVIAPDFLGHGFSDAPHDPAQYRMARAVACLVGLLDQLGVESADVIGYSMGGRVALSLAAAHPDRVGRLAVIGATPGLRDAEARAARQAQDEATAARVEALGVPDFIEWWHAQPIIATQRRVAQRVREPMMARKRTARAWGWAASLRGLGTGQMPPLWGALPTLACPTLLLTGKDDPRFTAIARAMRGALPNALHAEIAGAGHCAHLEQLDAVAGVLRAFLDGEL